MQVLTWTSFGAELEPHFPILTQDPRITLFFSNCLSLVLSFIQGAPVLSCVYISYNVYMLNGIFQIKWKNNHREIIITLCLRLLLFIDPFLLCNTSPMKRREMSIMVRVANEDSLWVSRLILSFQKIKNQDICCALSHTAKKKARDAIAPLFKAVFCMREVASAALLKTHANR